MNRILFFLIAILLNSCDPNTSRLVLVNETSEMIFYRVLTDTTFSSELYVEQAYAFETVEPNFRIVGIRNYKGWENKINREGIDSALHLFIFSTNQITDELIKNREYVRLSFTVKELDSLNWIVVYKGQNKISTGSIIH